MQRGTHVARTGRGVARRPGPGPGPSRGLLAGHGMAARMPKGRPSATTSLPCLTETIGGRPSAAIRRRCLALHGAGGPPPPPRACSGAGRGAHTPRHASSAVPRQAVRRVASRVSLCAARPDPGALLGLRSACTIKSMKTAEERPARRARTLERGARGAPACRTCGRAGRSVRDAVRHRIHGGELSCILSYCILRVCARRAWAAARSSSLKNLQ